MVSICVDGFKTSGARRGKLGAALIVHEKPCEVGFVATTHKLRAPHVFLLEEKLELTEGKLQALVAISGNSLSMLAGGLEAARELCRVAANQLGVEEELTGLVATGILGRRPNLRAYRKLIERAAESIGADEVSCLRVARAIMTTDKRPKLAFVASDNIKLGAIAKGAGMLMPELATMLCLVMTNASLASEQLTRALRRTSAETLAKLCVDEQSPNDTVICLSPPGGPRAEEEFEELLFKLLSRVAEMILSDVEGSERRFEVEVRGARSDEEAELVARSIASSPLVKAMFHGPSPNFGRILAAAGRVASFDPTRVVVEISSKKGTARVFEGEVVNAARAVRVMKEKVLRVVVDLRLGEGTGKAFGCDLSPAYAELNALYS